LYAPQRFDIQSCGNVNNSTTPKFYSFVVQTGVNTTEANVSAAFGYAGTVSDFRFAAGALPAGTDTWTIKPRINAADASITCGNITNSVQQVACTGSQAYSASDLFAISIFGTGSPTTTTFRWTFLYTPS
jgi:hypothetical protein